VLFLLLFLSLGFRSSLVTNSFVCVDMKRPERKRRSGIGELLRVGKVAQGLPPPVLPQLQEGVDALKPGGPKLLSVDDLTERLKFLSDWKLSPDQRSMSRTFQTRNFSEGESPSSFLTCKNCDF